MRSGTWTDRASTRPVNVAWIRTRFELKYQSIMPVEPPCGRTAGRAGEQHEEDEAERDGVDPGPAGVGRAPSLDAGEGEGAEDDAAMEPTPPRMMMANALISRCHRSPA